MIKYDTLSKLMAKAISDDVLPDIQFTDNTPQLLGTSVEHLSLANMTSHEFLNTPKNIATAIREYEYTAENVAEHYNDLMPIKKVADEFAKKLHVGIKSLSNIKKTVTRLAAEVMEASNERMSADASIAATLKYVDEPDIKFNKLEWNKLDSVNENLIFNELNSTIAVAPGATPSKAQIGILIDRLPFGTPYNRVEFKQLDINKDAAKATLNEVFKIVGSKMSIKDVKYVLTMLFDLDSFKCGSAVATIREVINDPTKITAVLQMVNDFNTVLSAVNTSTLKFSAPTKKELLNRCDVLNKYVNMAAYVCAYYRTIVWKDSVVVPGGRLNPDVWVDFRKHGGSSVGIAQHLACYHQDSPMPTSGVSYKTVLEKRKDVLAAAKEVSATNIATISEKKKNILRDTFIYKATDWLNKNKKKWSVQFAHANNVSKFVTSVYDSEIDASIESAFYKAIINSCCPDTIISAVYNNLSDMYLKHAKIGGELTEAQCEALDMTVYANMITEFLLKQEIIKFE